MSSGVHAIPFPRNTGMYVLNDKGEPMPCDNVLEWGRFMEDRALRIVEHTMVGTIKVSTVFLGLDHSFCSGPPMLWETMIFGGPLDQEMDRYHSLDSAQLGHAQTVARVRGLSDPS